MLGVSDIYKFVAAIKFFYLFIGVRESNISLFVCLCVSVGLFVCLPVRLSVSWFVCVKVDRMVSLYNRMTYACRSVILSTQTANIGRPDWQGSMTDGSMTDGSMTDRSMTDGHD